MKTRYKILITLIGFSGIFFTSQADAMCVYNEDWPQKPCLDTPPYSLDDEKQAMGPYYDYKGSEWMEEKKLEMIQALESGSFRQWVEEPDDYSHWNVYEYYSIFEGYDYEEFSQETFKQKVEIGIGQTIQLDDFKLYFYDIEDSRCPLDVTCVWEGNVTAMINLDNKTLDASAYFTPGLTVTFPPYEITMTDIQPHPISTEKPDYVATLELSRIQEFTGEEICGKGNVLVEGICRPAESSDFREGETLNSPVIIIIQSLGAVLIIGFIVFYAIKKRRAKQSVKKNEN